MRSSKYGSKCGCLRVCMHLYACLHVMNKKSVLFTGVFVHFVSILWGIWSWPVCVCIVCLLLERTITHLSVSKTNQPNNTTDRILVKRLYLSKWTFLPETCFLVFSFFFLHCQLSALAEHLGIEIMGMKLLFV